MVEAVADGKRAWQSIVHEPAAVCVHIPGMEAQPTLSSCAHVVRQDPACTSNIQLLFRLQHDCVKQLVSQRALQVPLAQRQVESVPHEPSEPYLQALIHCPIEATHVHSESVAQAEGVE